MKQVLTKKINIIITALFIFAFTTYVVANTSDKIIFSDFDQDGLSDEEEKLYGTDPKNADTDGDSYSDGTEIKSGYDPLKPAPGDKITNDATSREGEAVSSLPESATLTKKFAEDVQEFLKANDQETVTQDDLSEFVQKTMGDVSSGKGLEQIDTSKIKIKKQDYSDLSELERLTKEKEDWDEYVTRMNAAMIYAATENESPDLNAFEDLLTELLQNFATIYEEDPNYDYFRELGPKMEYFIELANDYIEVPETVYEMHVKYLSVIQGYIDLKNPSIPKIEDDLLAKTTTFNKVDNLNKILKELLTEEAVNYNKKFDKIK